jgi:hypothetical protein
LNTALVPTGLELGPRTGLKLGARIKTLLILGIELQLSSPQPVTGLTELFSVDDDDDNNNNI